MTDTRDLLIEIGVEELPPKSLLALKDAFEKSVSEQLTQLKLPFASISSFGTPRRLALLIDSLAIEQPEQHIEKLGPAVKASYNENGEPTPAALGFAKKIGLPVAELEQVDTDKGPRLGYRASEPGLKTSTLVGQLIAKALESLPIAKRMRWGAKREEFVRPVHWILMLFGNEIIDAEVMGLPAGNLTYGHRFHANKPIEVARPGDYVKLLRERGKVIADFDARRTLIRQGVEDCASKIGATAVVDEALLNEVTALVEWPVCLSGNFDSAFLKVPNEALISSMKEHQKYFHLVDDAGNLLANFITVSNINSLDPTKVVDGNERVIRPRLADAAFFYETDLKIPFESYRDRLRKIVFQDKLGTVYDKTERIASLAGDIADLVGAKSDLAKRAGQLCKNDLVSNMVGEFADLQGTMGRYYAESANEHSEISATMAEHYLPRFAGDALPSTRTGTAVALADRLDTLSGIFGIGQLPTGSKDPFALRRASLGVLRLLVEGGHRVSLTELLNRAHDQHPALSISADDSVPALMNYMLDRFSAWFGDMNIPAESFIAVRARGLDDPLDIYNRTLAVTEFSKSPVAPALAAANKRVSNILAKQSGIKDAVDSSRLAEQAEIDLFAALTKVKNDIEPLIKTSDYSGALTRLADLQKPVDAFFDNVMVMAEDTELRTNRLALLQLLRNTFLLVADISLLPSEN